MDLDVLLRELRYFMTVAEHLHFTRAVEELYVSQPALSRQIRALESQLHTELFVRDRRTAALTPAGSELLPHARSSGRRRLPDARGPAPLLSSARPTSSSTAREILLAVRAAQVDDSPFHGGPCR